MGEVVGRKKKAVVAGALALTLGAGLGLGAVAWGSEGSVPEGGVQSGDVWGPLVGKKLEEKAGAWPVPIAPKCSGRLRPIGLRKR